MSASVLTARLSEMQPGRAVLRLSEQMHRLSVVSLPRGLYSLPRGLYSLPRGLYSWSLLVVSTRCLVVSTRGLYSWSLHRHTERVDTWGLDISQS